MSEYQYYEFLAIDRPLTSEEIAALRGLSTRAHITAVSFTNEYQWGSFKGNPADLMKRFFDVHVYVANWMTAIFMVRLPIETIPKSIVKELMMRDILDFEATATHWLITWSLDESEDYDRFGMEDGRGWMTRLAPVRDELLRGDTRSLYIGWLAAVTRDMMDDDDMEPLSVEGLGNLTTAQQALAEFLEVDEDLLAGAGMGRPQRAHGPRQKEMDDWLEELPGDEVHAILKQLLEGRSLKAERTLKNRFLAWRRGVRENRDETPRRTVEELRKHAKAAAQIRLEQEKRQREMLAMKRRKERDAYLATLSRDFPKAWRAVRQKIERGSSGLAYDEACQALVDLSEAYSFRASRKAFQQELSTFMADYLRRKALIQRLVKAGIWQGDR